MTGTAANCRGARKTAKRSDPYRVWLSEIMLQQTTVKAVGPYYMRFLQRWPRVTDLAADRLEEVLKLWAGLGYYARARNLHACARAVVEDHGGSFPQTEAELLTLPGIGAYTAAAIAAIAFDRKAAPVDGNIERVIARLYAVEEPLPGSKPQIRAHAAALTPDRRAGDFAQAMMDLGATICTPKKPACALCPWREPCLARKRGDQETFPRKTPKAEGKLRRGAAFVGDAHGRRAAGPYTARQGAAREDDGSADHAMDARFRGGGCHDACAAEGEMASRSGSRHPRLHAFSPGAYRLSRERHE